MSSEVMRLAFGTEFFSSDAVGAVSPVPRAQRAAHYMAEMGLWRRRVARVFPGLCRYISAITVLGGPSAFRVFPSKH